MAVLALLKEGTDCDFDRLQHITNHDSMILLKPEHSSMDDENCKSQTLIDNVSL